MKRYTVTVADEEGVVIDQITIAALNFKDYSRVFDRDDAEANPHIDYWYGYPIPEEQKSFDLLSGQIEAAIGSYFLEKTP